MSMGSRGQTVGSAGSDGWCIRNKTAGRRDGGQRSRMNEEKVGSPSRFPVGVEAEDEVLG
jgi:hypothetical protein